MKFLVISLVVLLAACAGEPARSSAAKGGAPAAAQPPDPVQPAPTTAAAQPQAPARQAAPEAGFRDWVDGFRRQAKVSGISEATLRATLDEAQIVERVLELDRSQPEFTRSIWDYLDTAVSDTRVSTGRDRLLSHQQTARAVEAKFGVRKEIITAIWGVESNYGSHYGSYKTIDALATLGYDGRRDDFARRELLAALNIIEAGDIAADRMIGSWAGAMGHTQFLPSSFVAYAVDGDGDGKRDIWGSIPDVMASTANYLARARWQRDEPWGVEVRLPPDFDYAQAELDTRKPVAQWRSLGVRTIQGDSLPQLSAASIITPAGARGPAFLVGQNFRSIMRYNNSTSYALAVAHLADRIEGQGAFVQGWPRGEAALSRTQIKAMQARLNELGYGAGAPDGLVGPNTRSALRAYQSDQGLTADGFPTQSLYRRLLPAAQG
jgi:lytic murein transglycosylase